MASKFSGDISLGATLFQPRDFIIFYTQRYSKRECQFLHTPIAVFIKYENHTIPTWEKKEDLGMMADVSAPANTPSPCLMKALARPDCQHY